MPKEAIGSTSGLWNDNIDLNIKSTYAMDFNILSIKFCFNFELFLHHQYQHEFGFSKL